MKENSYILKALRPEAPFRYFNDGGPRQRVIFYTPKNPNFSLCLPKKIPTFLAYQKKNPSPTVNCAYVIVDFS